MILSKSKYSSVQFHENTANLNFKKFFIEENKLNPGYGILNQMTSRQWWSSIVSKLIQNDKHISKFSSNTEFVRDISDILFDQFSEKNYWEKYDNCDLILKSLKEKGYILGIISNFDERLFTLLENLELKKNFEFIRIPFNSNGYAKPNKEIFLNTMSLIKNNDIEPNQFLHVGDNIELDYEASKKCGFKSLLIYHNGESELKKIANSKFYNEIITNKSYAFNLIELKNKILDKF